MGSTRFRILSALSSIPRCARNATAQGCQDSKSRRSLGLGVWLLCIQLSRFWLHRSVEWIACYNNILISRHQKFARSGRFSPGTAWDEVSPELRSWLQAQAGWDSNQKEEENVPSGEQGLLGGSSLSGSARHHRFYVRVVLCPLKVAKSTVSSDSSPVKCISMSLKGGKAYLEYIEDISKNRPGGLKGRRQKPKIVKHHANANNPERCFVPSF